MSEAKHTPGPWFQHHGEHAIRICNGAHETREGCKIIAEAEILGYDRSVSEANARLIASAPQLGSALAEAHREIAGLSAYLRTCAPDVIIGNLTSIIDSLERQKELIEAAIHKAVE